MVLTHKLSMNQDCRTSPVISEIPVSWTDATGAQRQINKLKKRITELEQNLACVSPNSDGANLYFEGCNVHVRNGEGSTETINGSGNLIVGYDESTGNGSPICSDGAYHSGNSTLDKIDCEAAGEIWSVYQKTGSHNLVILVIGKGHSYTQYAGFVAGDINAINQRVCHCRRGATQYRQWSLQQRQRWQL